MVNFSIIIPHYNIPDQLIKLLESIPQKEDLQIIVVDDKSNQSLEKLDCCKKRFESNNCIFLKNTSECKGAGICRNIGMRYAKGKWLIFADADDRFAEGFYDVIHNNVERDEDIIFFRPTSMNFNTGELSYRHEEFCMLLDRYMDSPDYDNELILRYHVVSPWSKMIKHSLIVNNNIEFNNSKVGNDMMFCRKIGFHAKEIAVEKDCIYVVMDREGSLTKLVGKDSYEARLNEFLVCADYVRGKVDKKTWKRIHMNGGIFFHMCIDNKLGMIELIKTVCILVSKRIALR